MSALPSLRVAPVDCSLQAAVLDLCVLPAQQAFVGRTVDLLADAQSRPSCESMVILLDQRPIGLYFIETVARCIAGHDFDRPALGLRGFFIAASWQGQGLGTRALAALLTDLSARHPHAQLLALSVDESNHGARRLYQQAGFRDSGERYHGGRAGAQYLLLRELP
jgi:RimJ/RimL family protein N-acetyltransferase